MNLNYEKLMQASKMHAESLQEYDNELTEDEIQSLTQSIFQRALEGVLFPEIGKIDTQRKADATAIFLVKISQDKGGRDSIDDTIVGLCERSGHPELAPHMATAIKLIALLTEWISIYPDELSQNFPNTCKFYKEHETELNYSQTHIIRQTIASETGRDGSEYVNGVRNMLLCYMSMYNIFQDETGYSDEECADIDFMVNMLETWVMPLE